MKLTRRNFLGSAAAAVGGGLLAGCREKLPRYLVPHAVPPDDAVPGVARFYRTVCRECPAGCGVTARVRDGRAVKLEGSPDDPIGRGALCPRGQAAIEGLYSPSRLGAPRERGLEIGWDAAEASLAAGLKRALDAGRKVAVLTRPERGQLGALFGAWLGALGQPASQVATFDPMDRPWLREGCRRAFGTEATSVQDIAAARLLLSVGDDLVEEGSPVEHARALATHRAAGGRFVYVGPRLSLTAASADRWIPVEPGSELALVLGLARQVLEAGGPAGLAPEVAERLRRRLAPHDPAAVASRTGVKAGALVELAASLLRARPSLCTGPGRAVAGADAAALAEAVYVLNALLGNVGRTLRFLAPPPAPPGMDLAELARAAAAGEVGALVVHHADPLGFGPAFADLARALGRVPFLVAFANELDATGRAATLLLPDHHFLEAWSDVPVRPGVLAIQQPVMSPLLPTRAAADELLAAARALGKTSGLPGDPFGEVVRRTYADKDLERGGRYQEADAIPASLAADALAASPPAAAPKPAAAGLALVVVPSFRHLDGRPARSVLLQELPDPLSGFSWTGWVELHPATAAGLKVKGGDVVALEGPSGRVELPAHVTGTVREGVAAVPVGDALPLLGSGKGLLGLGVRVMARPVGTHVVRHVPEAGRRQHGRELARSVSRAAPRLPERPPLPSMYPPLQHPQHRWALSIDLDRCTGCSACTVACYVENNLPVVGPEEVARGRIMSWLRIQAFAEPRPEGAAVSFLPLGCQHCTSAPCESVCPTFATYHTREGLNAQVYSRCIGTRYCENNCPYGVRRFNFFDWPRTAAASLNPDVTVRERGVTEKCTLCVQRIRTAEEEAKVQGTPLRDGDVVSACAASCPTRAIVFGDLKDPLSEVSRLAADGRAYKLLEELNTDPGVFYLARRREA